MKQLEKLIPTAIDAVSTIMLNKEQKVPKEYNGYISSFWINIYKEEQLVVPKEYNSYISSFGASIITAGLLPTIIFFSQQGDSEGRHVILKGIEKILHTHAPELLENNTTLVSKIYTLYKNETTSDSDIKRLESKIFDAAVALKLAIRTFPKSKK